MPSKTSLLHLLHTLFLHNFLVLSHKLRHLFLLRIVSFPICSLIFQFDINYMRLLFGRFHCWISSPILIGLIVSCRANETRVVNLKEIIFIFFILLGHHLKRFEFSFMGWCEISLNFIWNFQSQLLFVKIELLRLCIWIKSTVFVNIVWLYVLWVFIK
jgi:hypothetical protein